VRVDKPKAGAESFVFRFWCAGSVSPNAKFERPRETQRYGSLRRQESALCSWAVSSNEYYAAGPQPSGLYTRRVDGGLVTSFAGGLRGRITSSPPQLGHLPPSFESAQEAQNVHSNEQMRASTDSAGRSQSQHSQFGRSSSISHSLSSGIAPKLIGAAPHYHARRIQRQTWHYIHGASAHTKVSRRPCSC
jgi:hypothetical protein